MSFENKKFYLAGSAIILAGLFFFSAASSALAAGLPAEALAKAECEKTQNNFSFSKFLNPVASLTEKVLKDFGYKVTLAAAPDPDTCGSDSVSCSGTTPTATISWNAAPAQFWDSSGAIFRNLGYYILTVTGATNGCSNGCNTGLSASYSVSGLTNGQTYTWFIEAYYLNSYGTYMSSASYGFTDDRPHGSFTALNCAPTASGTISANPNPIQVCSPETLGITTITAYANVNFEIRLNSSTGTLFAGGAAGTTITPATGKWVNNGTVFYLVQAGTANVLNSVTVTHTTSGCPTAFNFSLSNSGDISVAKPSSGSVSGSNTVTATLVSGTTQTVGLSASGLPANTSGSFSSNSCSPTCNSTYTITIQSTVVPGTYPITVTGTGGGLTKTTTFNLIITSCSLPTVPSLISPTNGSSLGTAPKTPTFSWADSTGETGYYVDLCTDSSCANYTNGNVSANTTQLTWGSSLSAGTYWWRVYAYNSCGGVHSAIWSFSVGAVSTYTLTVTKSGTGSGTVADTVPGSTISCGSNCNHSYTSGTSVTLTASPTSGSSFAGWSDACSGTGTCTVSMTQARNVTATFNISACVPTNPGCAANTCTGQTCWDGCNNIYGTKICGATTISGYVRNSSGAAIGGVDVTGSWGCFFGPAGPPVSATTNSGGYYYIDITWGSSCTTARVSASKSSCTFSPDPGTVTLIIGSNVNQNFTGTCTLPPTVDIKANGSDGPVSIAYNTAATLSWTSTNATGCTASGDWSGSKSTSGSESTGNLTSSKTYTLTCAGPGGTSPPDSVTVNVGSAPTLSVIITANPMSGVAPLNTALTANVSGTAAGTINYSFWWNCDNGTTNITTASGACGTLPTPVPGTCVTNASGAKCDGISSVSQSVNYTYSTAGSYRPKVIVERDAASPAQDLTDAAGLPNSPGGGGGGGGNGITVISCGDGTCNGAETCSTCPTDCGVCAYTLTVTKAGTGSGTVTSTSNPTQTSQINCGASCSTQSVSYNSGASVTLTTSAASGSTFVGWSGNADCSDGIVTIDASKTCIATFNLIPPDFSLNNSGSIYAILLKGEAGVSTETTITVIPLYGFSSNVNLSVQSVNPSLPSGSTFNFTPSTLMSAQYSSGSKFKVNIGSGLTASQTYTIVVQGVDGGMVRTTTVYLSVTVKQPGWIEF